MMNKYDSVPKLNLEPKLKRPLSLWNPLDYLRLLYWVFFFPQAIQWYVDKFNNKSTVVEVDGWRDRLKLLRKNFVIYQLIIQVFLLVSLTFIVPTYAYTAYKKTADVQIIERKDRVQAEHSSITDKSKEDKQSIEIPFVDKNDDLKLRDRGVEIEEWNIDELTFKQSKVQSDINYGLILTIASAFFYLIYFSPWKSMALGITFALLLSLNLNFLILTGHLYGSILPERPNIKPIIEAIFLLRWWVFVGTVPSISKCLNINKYYGMSFAGVILYVFADVGNTYLYAQHSLVFTPAYDGLRASLILSLLFFIIAAVGSVRLETWLISYLSNSRFFSRITPLPLPFVSSNLNTWLERDWNTGIYNANQIVKYTLQFIPVSKTINRVLATTPDAHLIYRVNQLAENPFDWKLIHFASAPLNKKVLGKNIRIDTPARATAAGFWYLHEQQPNKAAEAFAKVRSLLYGEEIYTLAETLAIFKSAKELEQIASLDLPAFPQDNLLRGSTWETLNKLRRVVIEIKTIETSVSHSTKALALNRAIGELTAILDTPETLLEAEKELIIEIAQNWKRSLERIARDIGNISVTKPVANPYVIGDPVQGSLFAGREDIMQQLEELWSGDRLQSVVLFGHRRMGKTSILLNIDRYINANIKIAYINLLRLGDSSQGVGEVLMQICDGIAEVTGILPPDDDALLKLPYRTFERYIKQIEQAENSLIIAIDEFEKIEELIELQRIPTDFLGFLRGIVQMNSRIALIFAGLHTLEEMTADYFQPFFASVIPLHVGFLNIASTRQILANPTDIVSAESSEFILDYTPEALNLIYTLTAGQPYLVQLVGFQLVRRYNQQMFERGIVRNPLFIVEDVTAIANREFFQWGRYYFEGVWGQAAQDSEGQQEIIKALAPYPQGLPEAELITQIQIDDTTARNAIAILQRHDVIRQTGTGWQIIVELFRRWVNLGSR